MPDIPHSLFLFYHLLFQYTGVSASVCQLFSYTFLFLLCHLSFPIFNLIQNSHNVFQWYAFSSLTSVIPIRAYYFGVLQTELSNHSLIYVAFEPMFIEHLIRVEYCPGHW